MIYQAPLLYQNIEFQQLEVVRTLPHGMMQITCTHLNYED